MARERIGIMGGSFNPIHARHIEMAVCAKREFDLDRIIFLPTGITSTSIPAERYSATASFDRRMTLELKAPQKVVSEATGITRTLLTSRDTANALSTGTLPRKEDNMDLSFCSYGRRFSIDACVLRSLAAATSFIAEVIFCVLFTE